jgi:hypothetical protein
VDETPAWWDEGRLLGLNEPIRHSNAEDPR